MLKKFREFLRDERGVSIIEYALLAALIAVVLVTSIQGLSGKIGTTFGRISTALGT